MEQEQITVTFYKGRKGDIIADSKEGKICIPDKNYCKQNRIYLKIDEVWRCCIKEEKENVIIIQPINRLMSAEENQKEQGDKLKRKFSES
jgi:hypothetical protein